MITEGEQKLVQVAGSSPLLTAFAAFAPGLLYEFLHRSVFPAATRNYCDRKARRARQTRLP
jgi:hypothetical protein